MTTLPILIIGAGPAGAFLAQIFRKAGLPFRIFEREDPSHNRYQGWGVSLQWTLPVVKSALPNDLGDLLRKTSVVGDYECYDDAGLTVMDGVTGDTVVKASTAYTIRCSRPKLKAYLAQHLDIQYNRNCIGYEYAKTESGTKVLAKFADGETVEGCLLLAADGAHSHVRDQLISSLGQDKPEMIIPPKGVVSANTHLTAAQWRVWSELSPTVWIARTNNGTALLGGTTALHKLPEEAKDDEVIADVYLIVIYHDESVQSDTTAKANEMHKTYWTQSASREELKAYAVKLAEESGMKDVFRKVISDVPVEDFALKPLLFTEMYCPSSLDSSSATLQRRVTIVGDAAHPMLPLRGEGLNNALLDAATIGTMIVRAAKTSEGKGHWDTDDTLKDIFHKFEEEMIPRGWRAIQLSRRAGDVNADVRQNSAFTAKGEKYWQGGLDLFESVKV